MRSAELFLSTGQMCGEANGRKQRICTEIKTARKDWIICCLQAFMSAVNQTRKVRGMLMAIFGGVGGIEDGQSIGDFEIDWKVIYSTQSHELLRMDAIDKIT